MLNWIKTGLVLVAVASFTGGACGSSSNSGTPGTGGKGGGGAGGGTAGAGTAGAGGLPHLQALVVALVSGGRVWAAVADHFVRSRRSVFLSSWCRLIGLGVAAAVWLCLGGLVRAQSESTPAVPAADGPVGPPAPDAAPPPSPGPSAAEKALAAEQEANKAELAALRATLEAVSAELGAEREQRSEEVIAVQEKAEKVEAARQLAPKLSGYIQGDWVALRQSSSDQLNYSTGDPLNEERFTLRRARLKVSLDRMYTA